MSEKPITPKESALLLDDLVGRVGRCSKGKLGLITHWKMLPWGLSWVGISLENGRIVVQPKSEPDTARQ